MSLCASEFRKHMQIETSMDEITEGESDGFWSIESFWSGEASGHGAEEHLVATAFWDGILGHLVRLEEAFTNCTRIFSEEHKRGFKRLIRGRHLERKRSASGYENGMEEGFLYIK